MEVSGKKKKTIIRGSFFYFSYISIKSPYATTDVYPCTVDDGLIGPREHLQGQLRDGAMKMCNKWVHIDLFDSVLNFAEPIIYTGRELATISATIAVSV